MQPRAAQVEGDRAKRDERPPDSCLPRRILSVIGRGPIQELLTPWCGALGMQDDNDHATITSCFPSNELTTGC